MSIFLGGGRGVFRLGGNADEMFFLFLFLSFLSTGWDEKERMCYWKVIQN